jgi:hypothetical protein
LASRLSLTFVDLVGARPLLAKRPLEEFRRLRRLRLSSVKSPAGCWHSRPFRWSRPLWLSAVEIPGMSAGRWLCPWPTLVVIPTTLAPETGEVSWVSMGLRRVPFLAEVDTLPSKSQGILGRLLGKGEADRTFAPRSGASARTSCQLPPCRR